MTENDPIVLGSRYAANWAELYPFTLSQEDRRRHMYVIGQTGTGKSTLLKDIIKQDILAGRGVGYIDPHGQDAEELLRFVPTWRADDVVYFNASDFSYPMAWNLLTSGSMDPDDRDRVAAGPSGVGGQRTPPRSGNRLGRCHPGASCDRSRNRASS